MGKSGVASVPKIFYSLLQITERTTYSVFRFFSSANRCMLHRMDPRARCWREICFKEEEEEDDDEEILPKTRK